MSSNISFPYSRQNQRDLYGILPHGDIRELPQRPKQTPKWRCVYIMMMCSENVQIKGQFLVSENFYGCRHSSVYKTKHRFAIEWNLALNAF